MNDSRNRLTEMWGSRQTPWAVAAAATVVFIIVGRAGFEGETANAGQSHQSRERLTMTDEKSLPVHQELFANGHSFSVSPPEKATGLVLVAQADPCLAQDGELWPSLSISKPAQRVRIDSAEWAKFHLELSPPTAEPLIISLSGDFFTETCDRNIRISEIVPHSRDMK